MMSIRLGRATKKTNSKTAGHRRRTLGRYLESLEHRRMLATIAGHVWEDVNGNGQIEAEEPGQASVRVYIDGNGNDQLDTTGQIVEPDEFENGENITAAGLTFSVVDPSGDVPQQAEEGVVAVDDEKGLAATGDQVFGWGEAPFFNHFFRLRVDFQTPASSVQIDFVGESANSVDTGTLQAYDSDGNLLTRDDTESLGFGEQATMSVQRPEADIAYVLAFTNTTANGGLGGLTGRFDALRIDGGAAEQSTLTDSEGRYELPVEAGSYLVRQLVPDDFQQTVPVENGAQSVTLGEDETVDDVDFANTTTSAGSWQNSVEPLDVDNDGGVFPIDALLIINELNNPVYSDGETGELPAPPDPVPSYFDVDGDGFASPSDAILVINHLNSQVQPNPAVAASPTPALSEHSVALRHERSSDIAAAIQQPEGRRSDPDVAERPATVLPVSNGRSMPQHARDLAVQSVESYFARNRS